MAIKRNGYGQLELNRVAFRRDGRVEAQMPYDASVNGTKYENGMVVILDKVAGVVKTGAIGANDLYGIVYTSEELYDSRKPGLKNFGVEVIDNKAEGPEGYNVLPRIGFLSEGDVITTNTVAKADAFADGVKVYAAANGEWTMTAADNGPVGVAKLSTMPDGQEAIEITIIKA